MEHAAAAPTMVLSAAAAEQRTCADSDSPPVAISRAMTSAPTYMARERGRARAVKRWENPTAGGCRVHTSPPLPPPPPKKGP